MDRRATYIYIVTGETDLQAQVPIFYWDYTQAQASNQRDHGVSYMETLTDYIL